MRLAHTLGWALCATALTATAARAGSDAGCPALAPLDQVNCEPVAGCPLSPLCAGLVALLHFDNDPAAGEAAGLAHDFAGLGNDATCSSNCPTVSDAGRFGGAYSFVEPQALAIANGATVSLSGSVTMSAWFFPRTLQPGWRIVLTKIQPSPLVANYGIPHNGTSLCVNFAVADGGWRNHCSATTFTPGRWYHLVGVLDGAAHRATLSVDDVVVVDDPEPLPIEQETGSVWIGWSPTNNGVDGLIDEVAIWSRALAPAEQAALYVAPDGGPGPVADGGTDAGADDGGTDGGADGGESGSWKLGCDCTEAGTFPLVPVLALAVLLLRRAADLKARW
jgi:uncharacterized protein (TIGR03382 family)